MAINQTRITRKGLELAKQMIRHFDRDDVSTDDLARPLSLLCRLAPAHDRIAVAECNGETTRSMVKREKQIEKRAAEIVASMPAAIGGKPVLVLGGDPRGYTMKIKIPRAEGYGNTWGLGGEYGIG